MITLTENAAAFFQKSLNGKTDVLGLRLSVKTSGCNGFAYVLDFAKESKEDDYRFENGGIQLLVDAKSYPLLKGTEIDCVTEGFNQQIRFNNPNVEGTCGCGESFNVNQ